MWAMTQKFRMRSGGVNVVRWAIEGGVTERGDLPGREWLRTGIGRTGVYTVSHARDAGDFVLLPPEVIADRRPGGASPFSGATWKDPAMTTAHAVRAATIEDLSDIRRLVNDLAEYEQSADAVVATLEDFRHALFPDGAAPATFCEVAEADGAVVGFALWFLSFSTWTGRHGIWLEDLYVEPEHRGSGLGRALLSALARKAAENGWARVEWTVLDWNAPSLAFYRSLGARPQDDWTTYRLDGDGLARLAAGGEP